MTQPLTPKHLRQKAPFNGAGSKLRLYMRISMPCIISRQIKAEQYILIDHGMAQETQCTTRRTWSSATKNQYNYQPGEAQKL
eukprot:scaffold89391_cov16-Prasinocladus_malaysianus.AAC.2